MLTSVICGVKQVEDMDEVQRGHVFSRQRDDGGAAIAGKASEV